MVLRQHLKEPEIELVKFGNYLGRNRVVGV